MKDTVPTLSNVNVYRELKHKQNAWGKHEEQNKHSGICNNTSSNSVEYNNTCKYENSTGLSGYQQNYNFVERRDNTTTPESNNINNETQHETWDVLCKQQEVKWFET